MEKYIGVKMIEAEPMTRGAFNASKGVWMPKEDACYSDDGYKVVYDDGYISWSPKEVFEAAYRRIDNMTFGLALEALKQGKMVRRAGWNGKNQWIELATNISYISPMGAVFNVNQGQLTITAVTDGTQLGWLASQADMLSEDWQLVE